ncbi:hypothetical protein [Enterococcus rotai]|uniref:hypothetical protein n=1 Tax=Enterococcus rotai TaxID=118060 RepID=UPI0032B48B65
MKKIVILFGLLCCSIFVATENVNAEAYIGDTDSIEINPSANKEAIEILKKDGDLGSTRFPLDKITTEEPVQSTNPLFNQRSGRIQFYYVDESKDIHGLSQIRTNYLAPAAFNWYQNGIPYSAVSWTGQDRVYYFTRIRVYDTGIGAYDAGYYWRRFSSIDKGRVIYFWLTAWNITNLIYG